MNIADVTRIYACNEERKTVADDQRFTIGVRYPNLLGGRNRPRARAHNRAYIDAPSGFLVIRPNGAGLVYFTRLV